LMVSNMLGHHKRDGANILQVHQYVHDMYILKICTRFFYFFFKRAKIK
jgi:hypothetical protein